MTNEPQKKMRILVGLLMLVFLSFSAFFATAEPQGASITYNSTGASPSFSPDNRSDARGTITDLILDTTQQVQGWKGYVGNVTGKFSLDDGSGYTLYDWDFVGVTLAGEVYASRSASITWAGIACANAGNVTAEETFHNMTATDADSISNTYNYSIHDTFTIGTSGGPVTITNNSCSFSTATYINSTRQAMASEDNTSFQSIILQDTSDNLVFATILEDDYDSYKTLTNSTYDFQLIVPESDVKPTPTTYYFYLELS